jgi:RNA polymerase sigma-70 factor, ECF subfamily
MGMEELELILRCKKNEFDAFETLISNYENKIYNLCFYTLKNKEDALDASQEVCLKIYKSISKFKGDSKFSTWVYRITHNTCMDFIKKRKDEVSFDEVTNLEIHKEVRIDEIIESKELKMEIKKCILKISNDFRTMIILRDVNGLSYQEISEILNIEVGTVKSRLNRAREALRNELIRNGVVRGC